MGQKLSLLTYNIHKGFSVAKIRFMLPSMRAAIEKLNPDFVFLQEVQGQHTRHQKRISDWPQESQFEFIAEALWPHYAYGKNAVYQSGHHGNAILSKHPIANHENIKLTKVSRASRSLLHASISLESAQSLHLLCIHLGLFKAERQEQVQTIIERVKQHIPEQGPLLMAGDFNDWRKDIDTMFEAELSITEAYKEATGEHAKTFPALKPTLSIDRIYYRGMTLEDIHCLDGKPWRLLSDHLPLYARFRLESN